MTWGEVYRSWWPKMAHLFSWTPAQICALTTDEFEQAVKYLKGVEANAR